MSLIFFKKNPYKKIWIKNFSNKIINPDPSISAHKVPQGNPRLMRPFVFGGFEDDQIVLSALIYPPGCQNHIYKYLWIPGF